MSDNKYRINRKRSEQSPTNSIPGIQSPRRWYLLFAGSEQMPRGGLGDLVQTFGSEDVARTAFLALRLKGDSVPAGLSSLWWTGRRGSNRSAGSGSAPLRTAAPRCSCLPRLPAASA